MKVKHFTNQPEVPEEAPTCEWKLVPHGVHDGIMVYCRKTSMDGWIAILSASSLRESDHVLFHRTNLASLGLDSKVL